MLARRAVGRTRQLVVLAIAVSAVAGLVALERRTVDPSTLNAATRATSPEFRRDAKASTWFCPGVIGNDDQVSGLLVISNFAEVPVGGTITRFVVDGVARQQRFAVPARSTLEVDALAGLKSGFVSALVESQGAALVVEQLTVHRAGNAVASCASTPSGTWFLADGFTGADSIDQIVVTNPSLDSAILDVSFVTAIGERNPQSLKGLVVPPESVRVFDLAGLDARNEVIAAVAVRATVGRVVVGRSQHYLGRGRLGYTMSLAASATSARWFFADGEKSASVNEEYVIYNPSATDQQLTFILADDQGVAIDPVTVTAPGRRVTKFAPSGLSALLDGRYSAIISATSSVDQSASAGASAGEFVVIERVTTRQEEKSTASAVLLGAPSASRAWVATSGVAIGVADALRVFNPGSLPATFRVSYLGPAGDVSITGYEEVLLAPGASASVLLGAETASTAVSVTSNEPIVVQRRIDRGPKQPINGAAPLVVMIALAP
jgi:P pilus assembly chaperone PapD